MAILDGGVSLASEEFWALVPAPPTASTIKTDIVRIRVVIALMMFLLSLPPLSKARNKNASCNRRERIFRKLLTGFQDYKIYHPQRLRNTDFKSLNLVILESCQESLWREPRIKIRAQVSQSRIDDNCYYGRVRLETLSDTQRSNDICT